MGIALPHIAAGDNLSMPFVGSLLKSCGAFFIRRQWGSDPMYNTVMKEYIELLLKKGHNIEAFVEGTRSRIGKLLQPRYGILKIITDAVLHGRVKDVYIVPMSIGYDKVRLFMSHHFLNGLEKKTNSIPQKGH
jgi:glycerol-3-phosphate O-acyltransferase